MDQMRGKGFRKENQTEICTQSCAAMHSFVCILIKGVKQKIENTFGKDCFLDVE
jgi:hypothetical protein